MELPALGNVLRDLAQLTEDNEAYIKDLSDVVLKDSTMTSQVLRVSNGAQFNPYGQNITTISKAIINIGFNEVRSISLSVSVIDTFLSKNPRQPLLDVIARSFHAATQARNIAVDMSSEEKEEIFIATLLCNLGEMAFLGSDMPQVETYLQELELQPDNALDVCREVLGVGFRTITKELAKDWGLGALLQGVLKKPDKPDKKMIPVILGEEISRVAGLGVKSPELRKVIGDIAKFTGLNRKDSEALILKSADEAATTAASYGAEKVCHLIPSSDDIKEEVEETSDAKEEQSSLQLQMRYLQELTELTMQQGDINQVLTTSVKALFFAVKFKRAAIALFNKSRSYVEARYIAGKDIEDWRSEFRMPVNENSVSPHDVFSLVVCSKQAHFLSNTKENELLRNQALSTILPKGDCVVAPLIANQRVIGVVYADTKGRSITVSQFKEFQLFANQANLSISLLTQNK